MPCGEPPSPRRNRPRLTLLHKKTTPVCDVHAGVVLYGDDLRGVAQQLRVMGPRMPEGRGLWS